MKNIIMTITKSTMCIGLVACVLLWSCDDNDDASFDPSIRVNPLTITNIEPSSALVGSTITIRGTNFSTTPKDNVVAFTGLNGVVNGVVTVSSSNSITATVPSGAITGVVTVTTNREETSGADFTVTYPAPTITSVSETSAVEGAVIVVMGTNFSPLASENKVKINGSENISVSTATTTSITFTIPSGTPLGTAPIVVSVQGVEVIGPDFTLLEAVTVTVPINESSDDVEEALIGDEVGEMSLGSGDLEIGEIDGAGTPDFGLPNIGLRFNEIVIPNGAVISSASIQFTADNDGSDPVEMTIFGENIGNAPTYTDTNGNLSARTLTMANAVWNIPEWVTEGDKSEAQKTVDISSIIQEIVNRSDWTSGNSLNIIMKPSGASLNVTSTSAGREAETFDGDAAPELIITFLK